MRKQLSVGVGEYWIANSTEEGNATQWLFLIAATVTRNRKRFYLGLKCSFEDRKPLAVLEKVMAQEEAAKHVDTVEAFPELWKESGEYLLWCQQAWWFDSEGTGPELFSLTYRVPGNGKRFLGIPTARSRQA